MNYDIAKQQRRVPCLRAKNVNIKKQKEVKVLADIYISSGEIMIRLLVSALLGGLIGMERESSKRPAGFRTHLLVSVGSASIMMISATAFDPIGQGNDPLRLAAQVITGIGFLGAGSIMREGSEIKGLTTAASLWICAAIGLSIGAGLYLLGGLTTLIVILTLTVLNRIDKDSKWNIIQRISKHEDTEFKESADFRKLIIIIDLKSEILQDIENRLKEYKVELLDVKIKRKTDENGGTTNGEMELLIFKDEELFTKFELINIIKDIFDMPGVLDVEILKRT